MLEVSSRSKSTPGNTLQLLILVCQEIPMRKSLIFLVICAFFALIPLAASSKCSDSTVAGGARCLDEMKQEWPELVGKDAQEAKKVIQEEAEGLQVIIVPVGFMVTMDYRVDRVRIFVDGDNKVSRTPRVG